VVGSDGTVHRLFPVAVGAAEGAAIRSCDPGSCGPHDRDRLRLRHLGAVCLRRAACHRDQTARHIVIDPKQERDLPTVACSFWTRPVSSAWWSSTPRSRRSRCPACSAKGYGFDLAVIDGNHRLTPSSSTSSTSGSCCARAGSFSWTTTSCRSARVQPLSS
jgi:hypothetical protein